MLWGTVPAVPEALGPVLGVFLVKILGLKSSWKEEKKKKRRTV